MFSAHRVGRATTAVAVVLLAAGLAHADEAASQWIDRVNGGLLGSSTLRAEIVLETRDHQGAGETLVFDLLRRSDAEVIRTLIEVVSPEAAAGTLYEIISESDQPPERWTYAPALGRLRKLVGFQWTDSFLGTEFTFEDLELTHPVERAGARTEVVTRESKRLIEITSAPYAAYSKVVTQIDPDKEQPVRVQFFDSAGVLWKTLDYEWATQNAHPLPHRMILNDVQTRARSTLAFRKVETGFDLPWSRFSESEIRRRLDTKATEPRS